MKYCKENWMPENIVEAEILKKKPKKSKVIFSPLIKKTIKINYMENPTPLSIGYIILRDGTFVEVPRYMYHVIFFQKFIETYTGQKIELNSMIEQIYYFNNELQLGIYYIDYGMGDGSHSLGKGYIYLPSCEPHERFVESVKNFEQDAQNLNFQIYYNKNGDKFNYIDEIYNVKTKCR